MAKLIIALVALVLFSCGIVPSIEQPNDAGSKYPTAWVRCELTNIVRNDSDVVLGYEYRCDWSDSDCPGEIGNPVICLSSESPCPEDYGHCHMNYDRSGVTCDGMTGVKLTKPYNCVY